jgi:Calcium binding
MAAARGHTHAKPVRGVMSSPRPKPSTKLLDAMIEEAIIDAYNDAEQITGLFTMLEEHLALPFDTEMLGITVTVTKIDLTASNEIIAICRRDAHKQTIPILELPLPAPRPDGAEWIDAYRRWRR